MKRIFVLILILLVKVLSISASEEISDEWGDDIFESGDIIQETEAGELEADGALEDEFLVSEGIEWGGSFTSSFESKWTWTPEYPAFSDLADPDTSSFEIDLGARLFFDARPDEDFRVFGKAEINYPFDADSLSVTELFSDFNFKDTVFFRAGKHTIHWGVGYFFSPADILNLTPIDPEDPEAEREGPVSIKTQMPVGLHNLYTYIIAEDISKPEELSVAPKAEFVIGNLEAGIGAYYKQDYSPKGMLTLTFPVLDLDIFSEAVAGYGSDKSFVRETATAPFVEVYEQEDIIFFSGTAGFRYTEYDLDLSFVCQYYYNGEGYKEPDILRNNSSGIFQLINNGDLTNQDLYRPGRHYCSARVMWSEILDSNFSASVLWIGNLSDASGQVSPEISLELFEYAGLSLGMPVFYGDKGDEFTPNGKSFSISLTASLGGGDF